MALSPSRIAFVLRDLRIAESEDADVTARHGTLARRAEEPISTFFDEVADAQVMADARMELLGTERRRWNARVTSLDEVLALDLAGLEVPVGTVIDETRAVEQTCLVAEIGFDFAKQQASIVVWG